MRRSLIVVMLAAFAVVSCTESAVEVDDVRLTGAQAPKPKNQAPVADVAGPYPGAVGSPILFDASGSQDPDGSIVQYKWEFGDGTAAKTTVANTEHTYAQAGTYTVRVRVRDNRKRWSSRVSTTATVTATAAPAVFVGAGDIAGCNSGGDEATAALLDGIEGTVYAVGDNAYPNGTLQDYNDCYEPSWGRHKERTYPVPGNHEYDIPGAEGYWDYWGERAGVRGEGWYSYNLGTWHIVALNSELPMTLGSAQDEWLRADLAANQGTQCVLAYFHHPRFNSGTSLNATQTQGAWDALYEYGADVVLGGHEHTYERFGPQDPTGVADALSGIRQFVIGTGGLYNSDFAVTQPNSEVRYNDDHAVLKFVLGNGSYSWELLAVDGTMPDAGNDTCR